MKVAGDLRIVHFHISVNGVDQLPHTKGLLFISGISLVVDGGGRSWVGDLLEIP